MANRISHGLKAAVLSLSGLLSIIQPLPGASAPKATFATIGGTTLSPYGWVDFCGRQPQECNQPLLAPANVDLTDWAWETLAKVNQEVNAAIEPVSNLDHWGTQTDHWDYPADGKGDCKIFALQKRRLLMQKGFPRQALLMNIVRDRDDQGHAILTVRTSSGDFILATGYRFIKRQSQEDPNVWVSIQDPTGLPGAAST